MSTIELQEAEPTLTQVQDGAPLPELDSSPVVGSNGSVTYIGGSSPDLDGHSGFDFTAKHKTQRHVLGNSASGKTLHPRSLKKQDLPKSVFSSVISLPKLKQQECHKRITDQYRDKPPKTFELPSYRGYITEKVASPSPQILMKKRVYDIMDSRYRKKGTLQEGLHLTWALTKRIERQNGNRKLDIRNLDKIDFKASKKTEDEYIKVCVDVSADEEAYDQEEKDLIGKNAVKEYHRHYQLLNKIESENEARKVKNSLYTNILTGISRNRLMPLKMDVVKRIGSTQEVNNK